MDVEDEQEIQPVLLRPSDFPGLDQNFRDRLSYCEENHDDIVSEILDRKKRDRLEVLSFDVFDTLLLRNDKSEARRFYELSEATASDLNEKFATELDALDILVARIRSTQLSYRTAKLYGAFGEGHIDEIYRGMICQLALPEEAAETLRENELGYEARNLAANAPFFTAAQRWVEDGGVVIAISDMYLPGSMISELITRVAGDRASVVRKLYASADHGHSKRGGSLYAEVFDDLETRPDTVLHIGDNLNSDVKAAKAAGCRGLHYPVLRAELEKRHDDLNAFVSLMKTRGIDARSWAQI